MRVIVSMARQGDVQKSLLHDLLLDLQPQMSAQEAQAAHRPRPPFNG